MRWPLTPEERRTFDAIAREFNEGAEPGTERSVDDLVELTLATGLGLKAAGRSPESLRPEIVKAMEGKNLRKVLRRGVKRGAVATARVIARDLRALDAEMDERLKGEG